jgi:type I restriction enzyme R subunit
VPTDSYGLGDGFLVPPRAVAVPLKFQRHGIRYDDLSEEEKDAWDALDWDEDGPPTEVAASDINKWLVNADTVDKVLADLMANGLRVDGGDRLAKTILFAKNQAHAEFVAERFDANYPHLRGSFARVISHRVDYAQSLIDDFSDPAKDPQWAISVDMLDTGIDVPEVANLVFFKVVRSKTKFWQMLGRGTRLRPDLFGPGADRGFFYLFDYCANLEYFSQDLPEAEGRLPASLTARLFTTRLELLGALDADGHSGDVADRAAADPGTLAQVRAANAYLLHEQVAAMNLDNLLVRPHRRLVERFANSDAWASLTADDLADAAGLAGLPAALPGQDTDAKRFDLLALRTQLAVLTADPSLVALSERIRDLAAGLETKAAIPLVAAQMQLICDVQTDEYWQDITVPMLEVLRLRLRGLIQFIDTPQRKPVYTDIEDEMGQAVPVILPAIAGIDASRFERKAAAYLQAHLDLEAVRKLRANEPLAPGDLADLERAFLDAGIGEPGDIARAAEDNGGLGPFVRSIVGLDKHAAKEAMGDFINANRHTANQIHFANLVVDYLCRHGPVPIRALYSAPFTDVVPQGPKGVFAEEEVEELVARLHAVRDAAVAS